MNHTEGPADTARLMAAAPELLEACQDALRTLRVAVRAGMEGFTKEEEDRIVESHGTVKSLREAIAKATGKAIGE